MKSKNLAERSLSLTINRLGARFAVATVATTLLLSTGPAQSEAVVTQNPSGNVTAIQGLLLNGPSNATQGCFDVEFVNSRGSDIFGAFIYDINVQGDALFVAEAVDAVLNAESTPVNTANQIAEDFYDIPWSPIGVNARVVRGSSDGAGGWTSGVPSTGNSPDDAAPMSVGVNSWAKFTSVSDDSCDAVSGNKPPVADANGPYADEVGVPIAFDGSASTDPDGTIANWFWDFGDGGNATGEKPDYTYVNGGVWNVTLEVTDDMGLRDSASTTADIGADPRPPLANAGGPYLSQIATEVTFDGSGSSTPNAGGTIDVYDWEFGDGTVADDAGPNPTHTYLAEDAWPVTLTVTDDLGGMDDDFTYAVIGAAGDPPVADAGGPYSGAADANIVFDGGASYEGDASISTYAWAFGDNTFGSGESPSHVYTMNGVFDVTLVVQDSNGLIDADQTTATIGTGNVPPTADANGPYTGEPDVEISFDGSRSSDPEGEIASYTWEFGDSQSGSGETTTHTYTAEGEFIATLTVTDAANATDSATSGVTISLPPPPPEAPPPPPPPEDSGGCFIATAAYGSYLGPELRLLRNFRDRQLLTNAPGQAFVRWYYRTSPPFADAIAEHGSLRLMARVALTPLVYSIKYPVAAGLLFLLMIVAALGWRMRPPSKAAIAPAMS